MESVDGIKRCVRQGKFGEEDVYDSLKKGAGEWKGGHSRWSATELEIILGSCVVRNS